MKGNTKGERLTKSSLDGVSCQEIRDQRQPKKMQMLRRGKKICEHRYKNNTILYRNKMKQ